MSKWLTIWVVLRDDGEEFSYPCFSYTTRAEAEAQAEELGGGSHWTYAVEESTLEYPDSWPRIG